jgi:hypothetical protein
MTKAFFSYVHKVDELDSGWLTALRERLQREVRELRGKDDFEIFQDRDGIGWGDVWRDSIQKVAGECLCIIPVVTERYFTSEVCQEELNLFSSRQQKGIILPLLYMKSKSLEGDSDCARLLRAHNYVDLTHLRNSDTTGEPYRRAIAELAEKLNAAIDKIAANDSPNAEQGGPVSAQNKPREQCSALILAILKQDHCDGASARAVAGQLVARMDRLSKQTGLALAQLTRYAVEHCLLSYDDNCFGFLESMANANGKDVLTQRVQASSPGNALQHLTDSMFFARVLEREGAWRAYFGALADQGHALTQISSFDIRVDAGYLASQHLLAGLLSHFQDDWRPVLETYRIRVAGIPGEPPSAFAHLQATQWNCWLVWGPSIPVCRCDDWRGGIAMQFGHGDENNSIPLLLRDEQLTWARYSSSSGKAPRAIVEGRLRWAPWTWQAPKPPWQNAEPAGDSPAGRAYAQRCLYEESKTSHAHHSDGLVLEASKIEVDQKQQGSDYFSAYLWLMFLVGTKSERPDLPRRLDERAYPNPRDLPRPDRTITSLMKGAELWKDLLPVFVHANLSDSLAFGFQQKVLVSNALALLREIWHTRESSFNQDDIAKGIQFHLVSGSDYPGCGCAPPFPTTPSLLDLLREGVASIAANEPDLAQSIVLPAEMNESRNPTLRAFYCACRMPSLIKAYYEYVDENMSALTEHD